MFLNAESGKAFQTFNFKFRRNKTTCTSFINSMVFSCSSDDRG